MSEIAFLLRMMVQGDKEGKVSEVVATDTPAKFISQLISGQTRRHLYANNVAASGSGEVGYGYDVAVNINDAMILNKGERTRIPVSTDLDLYLVAGISGETNMSVRMEEIA